MSRLERESREQTFGLEYFERLYQRADPWDYASSGWEIRRQRRVLGMISARAYRRALDFGCGEGHFTRSLKGSCEEVVGLDVSPTAIARARAAGGGGIEYRVGDHTDLGDPRLGHFDLIVCMDVLDYMPEMAEVEEVLGRFHTRLRPGGTLVVTVAYRRTAKASDGAKYRWDKCTRADWVRHLEARFRVVQEEILDSRIRQWVVIRQPKAVYAFDFVPVERCLRALSRRLPDLFGSTLALVARKHDSTGLAIQRRPEARR